MSTPQTEGSLETLTESECLDLLATHHVGRLAVVVNERPLIFPVNYALGDRIVAIRTADGTKLAAARNAHVAFEIDGYDVDAGWGWSVLVQGVAYEITEAVDRQSELARRLLVEPLAPGSHDRWLGIHPVAITGRRFQDSAHRSSGPTVTQT
jgi:nitroimidazol reductase NimA-like FMN-containing flavoprotein (pyridoxamine 5'-phosphate oxidase superfamily)